MKQTLLSLIVLVLFAGMATAQDPGKAYKSATRALGAYNLSPTENGAKLDEAIESIEVAISGAEQKTDAKVWNSRGEIYNAAASKDVNMLYLDQSHKLDPKTKDYAMMALESFRKGKELAEKKYQTKDALKGIGEAGSHLNAVGNSFLQTQAYSKAFPVLEIVMEVHNELISAKENGIFADETTANNHLFVTAFCANIAGDKVKAEDYFKKLL
jgi:tetratricopeptide (TPR) repeat protein